MDSWYLALLGLAEHFRTSKPPDIRRCIQCLMAVFKSKPPPKVEARTHVQLGTILYNHTKNIELARTHLEQAWVLSQNLTSFDDVKFEAASILAEVTEVMHQETLESAGRQLVSSNEAKAILRKALELSQGTHVYWHCRLLFQLAQMHAKEKDYASADGLLGVGVDYAQGASAQFTGILFTLSKAMLQLTNGAIVEAAEVLKQGGAYLEAFNGTAQQKEYLKVFFLVLQVCHYLMVGQVKSVKPGLKQLQQSVQNITQPNWPGDEELMSATCVGDNFMWLPKEHMCVLVYLVTISHSMQAGYMEKAQKYCEKALAQVEKMKTVDKRPLLVNFHRMILEHLVLCQLVMGHRGFAMREINNLCHLLYHSTQPDENSVVAKYQAHLGRIARPQMHSLLGLYAMSLDSLDVADHHFTLSLHHGNQSKELLAFVQLNMAIIRLMKRKNGLTQEDAEYVEKLVNFDKIPQHCHGLKAAALYVRGLHAFLAGRYNEAKSFLRDTLKMANAEDLNRLTSISLVLLGHIFLALNNSRESMNMVTPAMQLASKIPDLTIQVWAASIQRKLYRNCGEVQRENDCNAMVQNFSQTLMADYREATQLPEHRLLTWIQLDELPPLIQTTPSGASAAAPGTPATPASVAPGPSSNPTAAQSSESSAPATPMTPMATGGSSASGIGSVEAGQTPPTLSQGSETASPAHHGSQQTPVYQQHQQYQMQQQYHHQQQQQVSSHQQAQLPQPQVLHQQQPHQAQQQPQQHHLLQQQQLLQQPQQHHLMQQHQRQPAMPQISSLSHQVAQPTLSHPVQQLHYQQTSQQSQQMMHSMMGMGSPQHQIQQHQSSPMMPVVSPGMQSPILQSRQQMVQQQQQQMHMPQHMPQHLQQQQAALLSHHHQQPHHHQLYQQQQGASHYSLAAMAAAAGHTMPTQLVMGQPGTSPHQQQIPTHYLQHMNPHV